MNGTITIAHIITWFVTIGVGVVIIGLIKFIVTNVYLTKVDHHKLCDDKWEKGLNDIKDHFNLKVENVLLKEIRKRNGP